MATPNGSKRPVWEDQFNDPTLSGLRRGLNAEATELFDAVHKHLLGLNGVGTSFVWHGANWRWTIEYRIRQSKDPIAVVVPSPENLQLAIPLERRLARSLSNKRLKRSVREGLDLAQDPFDTHWGVWSIQPGMVEDIVDLVETKRRHLAKQAG